MIAEAPVKNVAPAPVLWPRAEVERREVHLRTRLEVMVRAARAPSVRGGGGVCTVCAAASQACGGVGLVEEMLELARGEVEGRAERTAAAQALLVDLPELLRPTPAELAAAVGLWRFPAARAELLRLNIGPGVFRNGFVRWLVRLMLMDVQPPRAEELELCPWCMAELVGVNLAVGDELGWGWDLEAGGAPTRAEEAVALVRAVAREAGGEVVIDVLKWGIAALEGGARLGEVRAGVEEALDLFTPYVKRRSPVGVRRYFGLWLEGVRSMEHE